eukprot:11422205-Alexandrium_andersonii.AAC.1
MLAGPQHLYAQLRTLDTSSGIRPAQRYLLGHSATSRESFDPRRPGGCLRIAAGCGSGLLDCTLR